MAVTNVKLWDDSDGICDFSLIRGDDDDDREGGIFEYQIHTLERDDRVDRAA